MGKLGYSVAFLASSGEPGETKVLVFVESHLLFSTTAATWKKT